MSSDLLQALEAISRDRADRVVRLSGRVIAATGEIEPLEVLIYRGFSSCTTHPTAFDPDTCVLPQGGVIDAAELLVGPLQPQQEQRLQGPIPAQALLDPTRWYCG